MAILLLDQSSYVLPNTSAVKTNTVSYWGYIDPSDLADPQEAASSGQSRASFKAEAPTSRFDRCFLFDCSYHLSVAGSTMGRDCLCLV
jgi:hypothetical protein